MAFPGPDAGGDFLGQMMGDLLKLMGGATAGGARVDLARMLAQGVASGGVPEANVDPAERIRVEELARVAELHVDELTAEALSARGVPRQVTVTTPGAWAWQTVDDWGFLLDAMSASGGTGPEPAPAPDTPPEPGLGLAELGDEAGAGVRVLVGQVGEAQPRIGRGAGHGPGGDLGCRAGGGGHGIEEEGPVVHGLPRPRSGGRHRHLAGHACGGERLGGQLVHVELGHARQLLDPDALAGIHVGLGHAAARHPLGQHAGQVDAGAARRRAADELEEVAHHLAEEVATWVGAGERHPCDRRRMPPLLGPRRASGSGPMSGRGRQEPGVLASLTVMTVLADPRSTTSCTLDPGGTV